MYSARITGVNGNSITYNPATPADAPVFAPRSLTASTQALTSTSGGASLSANIMWPSQYQYYFTGILPTDPNINDQSSLALFYRDMYLHDAVAGSAVDMQSSFPYSDYDLQGLEKEELTVYEDACAQLNFREVMPLISSAYLMDGFFCGTLIYDAPRKRFMDIMVHDALQCAVRTSPFVNVDPSIRVTVANSVAQFLRSDSDFNQHYIDSLPESYRSLLEEGSYDLNPVSTMFLPRKVMTDRPYTSYLHRALPMYLVEKTLFRGTLMEAHRKQRAIAHLTAGDDTWTPTDEELNAFVRAMMMAESEPSGGWIATRNSVQVTDLRCLGGDTLINTDAGLIQIRDMVPHNPDDLRPGTRFAIDVQAKNHTGQMAPVKYWWYQGYKQTRNLDLSDGTHLEPTDNHRFLTVGSAANLELVRVSDITDSTWLLKSTSDASRVESLELDLDWPDVETRPSNSGFTLPTVMTPALAYCIALILSEGYVNTHTVSVVNSNFDILARYEQNMEKLFGIQPTRTDIRTGPYYTEIRGSAAVFTKDTQCVVINSKHLVDTLAQLGVRQSATLRGADGTSPSYSKIVPSCILQADRRSQLAFLAGYLDGDGSFKSSGELVWRSTSQQIASSVHAILGNLGFEAHLDTSGRCCSVNLSTAETLRITPLLKATKLNAAVADTASKQMDGIPADVIVSELLRRDITKRNEKHNGERGSRFVTDDGSDIFIVGGWKELFKPFLYASSKRYQDSRSYFSYASYEAGLYDEHLRLIRRVSPSLYRNVQKLFSLRYKFLRATVSEGRMQHVYDLTMDESGPPTFCANSIVSKNSGGDFWKWTDMGDILVAYKLRALGISESFLSADQTYASAEASYNLFMEQMAEFRYRVTRRVFYHRLFPLVAVLNGFYKDPAAAKRQGLTGVKALSFLYDQSNRNNLRMPTIHWHKSLEGTKEDDQFDLLEKASEKGVPIPLKMYMSAASLTAESLLRDLEEDTKLRETLAKYTGKDTSHDGEDEMGEAEDGGEIAAGRGYIRPPSMSAMHGLPTRVPILARDFGNDELFVYSKTGKKKSIFNQKGARDRLHGYIVKAHQTMQDPNERMRARKANAARIGNAAILEGF